MSRSRQPPLVTGISPNEGIPWTKVTIRGENLGTGPADLIGKGRAGAVCSQYKRLYVGSEARCQVIVGNSDGLTICGHNCLLTAEWMSASKIVCRVGQAKNDKGDIIVTTKSGGRGTSTVSFKLLRPEKIGILDQSAVWVDEMNYYDMRTDRNKGIPPLSLRPANPLGIEIEKGKFPQKDLETLFPGMSADFTSENFSAAWYLIENHSSASFEQLKMAITHLKRQANKKSEGSLAYVKGGLSTFFEAQDALSGASNTADTLFQEVLGRKDKADSTRNALNVLQRFKFLFNLPLSIERNIQKGDYDVVINDYEKAKSLFGKTEVQVFKKYYAEVETRIEALRELLLEKLLETPSTLHDQKRYIRHLSDLHAPGDPAWQCIGAQHRWILQLMHGCREGCMRDLKGKALPTPPPLTFRESKKTPPLFSGPPGLHGTSLDLDAELRASAPSHLGQMASLKRGSSFQPGRDDAWRCKTPHRVAFVEKLTKLVLSQLPNFWKLWISYVNGSLFSEVCRMIQEVMQCLAKLVRGALLPLGAAEGGGRQHGGWEGKAELPGQWLAHIIQTLRLTYDSLAALEIPSDLLQTIQDLVLDLRVRCVVATLQHTAEGPSALSPQPCRFERCVLLSLQSLRGVLECKPGEASVSVRGRLLGRGRPAHGRGSVRSQNCRPVARLEAGSLSASPFRIGLSTLDALVHVFTVHIELHEQKVFLAKYKSSHPSLQVFQHPKTQEEVCQLSINIMQVLGGSSGDPRQCRPSVSLLFIISVEQMLTITCEQRLLIVLSNCCYLERHTFLNIAEHFEKHNFQGIERITQVSMASLKDLDQRLFESYIELKADPIVGSLEPGIYAGYFDWRDCLPPTGGWRVCVTHRFSVFPTFSQVFTVSRDLVPRVLSRVVEAVSEELSRLMQCVSSFSRNGALQVPCSLRAPPLAGFTLSRSSEPIESDCWRELRRRAGATWLCVSRRLLEELLSRVKSGMHLQLACFQAAPPPAVKT
ncbi:hypothetical protein MJG53_021153, partial [Ovis ammon polii x Ovis aries]